MATVSTTSDPAMQETLVAAAREGCERSFEELVRLHQRLVRAYLSRFVRCRQWSDDLAQETFLAAWRSLHDYDEKTPIDRWLVGIARNRALSHLRSEVRRSARETKSVESGLTVWRLEAVERLEPEDAVREITSLQHCLQQLPSHSRQLVQRYYFDGERAEHIAEQLGRRSGTIRMALSRIRDSLRRCVQRRESASEVPT